MARRKARCDYCPNVDARSEELLNRMESDMEWVAGVPAGLLNEYRLRDEYYAGLRGMTLLSDLVIITNGTLVREASDLPDFCSRCWAIAAICWDLISDKRGEQLIVPSYWVTPSPAEMIGLMRAAKTAARYMLDCYGDVNWAERMPVVH